MTDLNPMAIHGSVLVNSIETVEAFADEGVHWLQERGAIAREAIRENPLGVTSAIFGAGMLVGMLLNRR